MHSETKKEISVLDFYPELKTLALEYKHVSWQQGIIDKIEDYIVELFISHEKKR